VCNICTNTFDDRTRRPQLDNKLALAVVNPHIVWGDVYSEHTLKSSSSHYTIYTVPTPSQFVDSAVYKVWTTFGRVLKILRIVFIYRIKAILVVSCKKWWGQTSVFREGISPSHME
jgi:hypothetical protein